MSSPFLEDGRLEESGALAVMPSRHRKGHANGRILHITDGKGVEKGDGKVKRMTGKENGARGLTSR